MGGGHGGSRSGGRQEVLGRTTGTGVCKVGHKHLQHVSSCPTEWNLCFCFSFYFCLLDLVGPPPHQLLPATTPRVQSLPKETKERAFWPFVLTSIFLQSPPLLASTSVPSLHLKILRMYFMVNSRYRKTFPFPSFGNKLAVF